MATNPAPEPEMLSAKWSKGNQKEKVNNMLLSEAPKFKLITPSILSDRLGEAFGKAICEAVSLGFIKLLSISHL
ncbi:hypothetical protein DCAR_0727911 [Daucus carota subsp. sativus]|uniref:Uncharacterized protein n=1 Tax=Daucus carota subsp. sativus TaxID=79200 RepID=A0AAF0XIL4_DAUCS|nr:hypothetical protein DCAR_0727911 [Daucus carota subsp. sativus]